MANDWADYKGYLSRQITEARIFVEGYNNDQLINAMIDHAEERNHKAVGKGLAETFVFETLVYGIESMAKSTGLDVQKYRGPELVAAQ